MSDHSVGTRINARQSRQTHAATPRSVADSSANTRSFTSGGNSPNCSRLLSSRGTTSSSEYPSLSLSISSVVGTGCQIICVPPVTSCIVLCLGYQLPEIGINTNMRSTVCKQTKASIKSQLFSFIMHKMLLHF